MDHGNNFKANELFQKLLSAFNKLNGVISLNIITEKRRAWADRRQKNLETAGQTSEEELATYTNNE